MKIIVRIILFLVVVALLLLVGSLFIPKQWEVQSANAIRVEPNVVFKEVNHLKTWGESTAWTKEKYPEITRSHEGPESGKGAIMKWDDGKMEGVITVENSVAPNALDYDLSMDDGAFEMKGGFEFMPDAEGTRVIWYCRGTEANPIGKYMMLFVKPMMEKDFEIGLANLKTRLEKE